MPPRRSSDRSRGRDQSPDQPVKADVARSAHRILDKLVFGRLRVLRWVWLADNGVCEVSLTILTTPLSRFRLPTVTDQRGDERDPARPVYVISVAAELVRVHPRTLRIYELEGLICPARTRTNIRLYSENDVRRVLWIRHLTRNLGVNLAGVRVLFELEERLGMRILETLYEDNITATEKANRTPTNAGDGEELEASELDSQELSSLERQGAK